VTLRLSYGSGRIVAQPGSTHVSEKSIGPSLTRDKSPSVYESRVDYAPLVRSLKQVICRRSPRSGRGARPFLPHLPADPACGLRPCTSRNTAFTVRGITSSFARENRRNRAGAPVCLHRFPAPNLRHPRHEHQDTGVVRGGLHLIESRFKLTARKQASANQALTSFFN